MDFLTFVLFHSNMSIKQVCQYLGVATTTWQNYLKDYENITFGSLVKLSGLMGISPEEFMYRLIRNKQNKLTERDKWYLDNIRSTDNKTT